MENLAEWNYIRPQGEVRGQRHGNSMCVNTWVREKEGGRGKEGERDTCIHPDLE